jgi:aerobic carbon-monoxide dehydrogenase medium subunit
MKPAAFEYHAPAGLDEALALLAAHGGEARPIAGGQSLVPMMNMRLARPGHLVDLNGLGELAFLREEAEGVAIGALVRHCEAEGSDLLRRRCPILAVVAGTIGHYAIRQRGTVGGSLALADPAAQWPLLAMLFDARIDLAGPGRRRSLPAGAFFRGIFTTAATEDELLVGACFPALAPGEGWAYRAFCRRQGDFAIVAVAAALARDAEGAVARLRLAFAGVGDRPVRLDDLAAAQPGRRPDREWMRAVAAKAAAAIAPDGDVHASAEFRRELAIVLTERALADALARTGEER